MPTARQASTLYDVLDGRDARLLDRLGADYRLTHQELRKLAEAARDLDMWREARLEDWWRDLEDAVPAGLDRRQRKKRLLALLEGRLRELRQRPTAYPATGLGKPYRNGIRAVATSNDDAIFGDCPVASPKTVCCNLRTIDATQNCAYGCSYCTIQTFYGDTLRFDPDLEDKLARIALEPDRRYHIGTGQSSDSLAWGNKYGILDKLCDFARARPNVVLELKTKSANVSYFMRHEIPGNVVCAWSLNTDTIVRNEEHLTAGIEERIAAARKVASRGIKVAFHFHPMIHYEGWRTDYAALAARLLDTFDPEEVLWVSFGSVTFIKPVIREIRRRGEPGRILQAELVPDPHGKLTYPDRVKIDMFRHMHAAFEPWRDSVYTYLCMERADIWDAVFGGHYPDNDAFEADFLDQAMRKLGRAMAPA